MGDNIRRGVAPVFVSLCLILGGSAQGIWTNAFLQLLAIGILAWAALDPRPLEASRDARRLGVIIVLFLLLVAMQLVPMPRTLWSELPGRAMFDEGFGLLGISPRWLPLSLAPYDSLATLPTLLPPLAVLAAILRFGCRSSWLAFAVVGTTGVAVLLGVLQVAGPASADSTWYFYRHSNFGVATGFFANGNHMATLLLVAIPLLAALGVTVRNRTDDARKRAAAAAAISGAIIVVFVGIVLNGSLAGYGLVLPVGIATILLVVRPRQLWVRNAGLALGLITFVSFGLLVASPLNQRFVTEGAANSVSTRQEMLGTSVEAFQAFSPAGSGFGTFGSVYRVFEDPSAVDEVYVSHAHNDYMELAVEMGLPGIAFILLFLVWWGRILLRIGQSRGYDQFASAGAIASAAILVHSAVDFPLRTAAGGALFAASLGLMIMSKRSPENKTDLWPARHLVVH